MQEHVWDIVDVKVGRRIRTRRLALGISQSDVANALEISVQQVAKYERGQSSLNARRLFAVARVLNVPVAYFFTDVSPTDGESGATNVPEPEDHVRRDTVQASSLFAEVPDNTTRRALLALIRAVVEHARGSNGGSNGSNGDGA